MAFIDVLRKLGLFRAGAVKGKYTSGRDMPAELLMDDVYDKKKDTVSKEDVKKVFKGGEK
jgi:hypothetical protein